jgi:hypothetical protein
MDKADSTGVGEKICIKKLTEKPRERRAVLRYKSSDGEIILRRLLKNIGG